MSENQVAAEFELQASLDKKQAKKARKLQVKEGQKAAKEQAKEQARQATKNQEYITNLQQLLAALWIMLSALQQEAAITAYTLSQLPQVSQVTYAVC